MDNKREFTPKLALGTFGLTVALMVSVSSLFSTFFRLLNGGPTASLNDWQIVTAQFAMQFFGILGPCVLVAALSRTDLRETFSLRPLSARQVLLCLLLGVVVMFGGNYLNTLFLSLLEAVFGELTIPDVLDGSPFYTAMMAVSSVIVAPLVEEACFRGAIYKGLSARSSATAIVLSALLFGLFHLTFYQILYAFVVGLFLGTAVHFTRSIWSGVLIHFAANAVSVALTVFPVAVPEEAAEISALSDPTATTLTLIVLAATGLTVAGLILLRLYFVSRNRDRAAGLPPVETRHGALTGAEKALLVLLCAAALALTALVIVL